MKVANAKGKDWRSEIYTFLLAYRSTPNETTGVSPAKQLFGYEIRTKIPVFSEERQSLYHRDAKKKQKGKDYADARRHAVETYIKIGDKVLVE